VTSLHLIT